MGKIIYNKLVRDRIPEILQQDGRKYEIARMPDAEFDQALREKLIEEAQEVVKADDINLIIELADLQEIIITLLKFHAINSDEFETLRLRRFRERGGFENQIRLLWID